MDNCITQTGVAPKNTGVTFRQGSVDDLRSVCILGQEVNRLHHIARPDVFSPPSEPERDADMWREAIQAPCSAVFLAESDSAVIGFISVKIYRESSTLALPTCYAKIEVICVTSSARGSGIGKSLAALAERWGLSQGASEIRLSVWKFNSPAIRLYEHLGYGVRSLTMGKPLVSDEN